MFSITQPKIAGLTPRWAPFPGFSLLFDNAPSSYVAADGVETLARAPESGFYRRLAEGLEVLRPDVLLGAYGFCALPPSSYHVTAFDVMNVGDLVRCRAEWRDDLLASLNRLSAPKAFGAEMLDLARESALATTEWNLEFRYGSLERWGGLVVRLEPIDEARFSTFLGAREALCEGYADRYGVGAKREYTPHVSLNYSMNREGSQLAAPCVRDWDAALRERVGGEILSLRTASLYGFADMATFFRRAKE